MAFSEPLVVIGHRGAAGLAPENTLPSFRAAVAQGVGAVELDVHRLEDTLVVIHDDTVDRTTSGRGPLSSFSVGALRALDAGDGARVPTLAEVFEVVPAGVGINVELKGRDTAGPLADFLAGRETDDVLVSSFDHAELTRFHDLAPGVPVAPLLHRWDERIWEVAGALGAWSVNLSLPCTTEQRVAQALSRGLAVLTYTVNELSTARRLVDWGVRGLFTDVPDRIRLAALAD